MHIDFIKTEKPRCRMEPMHLGSPPSSPASPGANINFLPPFLLGEAQPSTPVRGGGLPNFTRGMPSQKYALSSTAEPSDLRQKLFNQSVADMGYHSSFAPQHVNPIERHGPPKQGLFDTIENKRLGDTTLNSSIGDVSGFNGSFAKANESVSFNQTLDDSVRSNTRSEGNETMWVTVFGFPPSALSVVLAHFANLCSIVDKKIPTQGNWVHLKLGSFNDVRKALSFNGKRISHTVMIGVAPYNNVSGNKENLDCSLLNQTSRARSLRQTAVSPTSFNAVNSPQNVPQKSTGLVSKAMEYVFGW